MNHAIFPGSFDPFTRGHFSIVMRALNLFDRVVIAVGQNTEKKSMTSIEQRVKHIEHLFKNESKISVMQYSGLTVEFCKTQNAEFIVRGLRNAHDFYYEQSIAQTNFELAGIDTVFLSAPPQLSHLSSSIARDLAKHGGDLSSFLPEAPE